MPPKISRLLLRALLLSSLLTACNDSYAVRPAPVPVTPPAPETPTTPPVAPPVVDQGKALGAYLHDLSVADPAVTFDNARLEHYRIATSSGETLPWLEAAATD